ncbi:MAG: aminotransferase class V-fold PLP-dependent enzyme [Spirochaetes bacterium]|nr:aminotransferase class V-fold PLP-dependent enzyme [Spirochaetota bacterium]
MERQERLIYLDNAATVFPKPDVVLRTMMETYQSLGVSPGRGGYDLAVMASEMVTDVREHLCRFFGGDDPERVIFASNASDALNLVIQGMIEPGCHVVSSRLEHNSVLRPLHHLQEQGLLSYDLVGSDGEGRIDPEDIARAIQPSTRMVIVNHASNVIGSIQDVEAIGRVCRNRNVTLVLDVAQSAGLVPIRMRDWGVSVLAFTGHKSLMGPTGIGGLVLAGDVDIRTTRFGGTGVDSESLVHTQSYPYRLETGTLNCMGIIGLGAGLEFVEQEGSDATRTREVALAKRLALGLAEIPAVRIHGPSGWDNRLAVLTINVRDMVPEDVGAILDGDYGIAVRTGLHCAPLVHQELNTFPQGGVRFSIGPFTTGDDIDSAIAAMTEIGGVR